MASTRRAAAVMVPLPRTRALMASSLPSLPVGLMVSMARKAAELSARTVAQMAPPPWGSAVLWPAASMMSGWAALKAPLSSPEMLVPALPRKAAELWATEVLVLTASVPVMPEP